MKLVLCIAALAFCWYYAIFYLRHKLVDRDVKVMLVLLALASTYSLARVLGLGGLDLYNVMMKLF